MKELTLAEKHQQVRDLRPIDDIFFEALAEEKGVCQEILQTIMEDKGLIVNEVITQHSGGNLYGRGVRLDALCTLGDGSKCNIEVQRSDNDNHLKRARFNASVVTVKDSHKSQTFDEVVELYIVYITEFDFLKEGHVIYHIDKHIRETGSIVDDGLHEIFVNTTIDDGSDISALMSCFTKKEVNDSRFPELSSRVNYLKMTDEGVDSMSGVWQSTLQKEREKAENEGIAKGRANERIDSIRNLLKIGITPDVITGKLGYTEEEYALATK